MSRGAVDVRRVLLGAAVALGATLPVALVVQILEGGNAEGQESNLWILVPLALLGGFTAAGYVAAARARATPLVHAALAGALGFAVIAGFSVVRRAIGGDDLSLSYFVRLLLLAQICISVALLGGYLSFRRRVGS